MASVVISPNDSVHSVEYVVFDVETTGFDESTEHIIEIGAIKFNTEREIDTFQHLIKPPVDISDMSSKVHGITNDMVKNADPIEVVIPLFMSFIKDTVLVAHNIDFDIRFLNVALTRIKLPTITNIPLVDTVSLSRKAFPNLYQYKLGFLIEQLNLGGDTFHRALEDSHHTRKLLLKCIDALGVLGELELKEVLVG